MGVILFTRLSSQADDICHQGSVAGQSQKGSARRCRATAQQLPSGSRIPNCNYAIRASHRHSLAILRERDPAEICVARGESLDVATGGRILDAYICAVDGSDASTIRCKRGA